MNTEPLYLTDSERPIRPPEMRERYRFYAVFQLHKVQYTRWFTDPSTRAAYVANHPGVVLRDSGEETPESRALFISIARGSLNL